MRVAKSPTASIIFQDNHASATIMMSNQASASNCHFWNFFTTRTCTQNILRKNFVKFIDFNLILTESIVKVCPWCGLGLLSIVCCP